MKKLSIKTERNFGLKVLAILCIFQINGQSWGQTESVIYSTGFESSEGFTAGTSYNNSTVLFSGIPGQQWGTYYGTPSTTSAILGLQSMQMRWYTATPSNLGYTFTNFNLANVSKVTFKSSGTAGINVIASFSTDGGNSYSGEQTFILSTTISDYQYNISATGEYPYVRIKFQITYVSTPVSTSRLYLDDIKAYGISSSSITPEPSNHATSFTSSVANPAYSTINLSWTDATGTTIPDGYLIKASTALITDPADGTQESDALLVKNIAAGIQSATFTGLTANTSYNFKIYPYTNSGSSINYKTDGTVPSAVMITDVLPWLEDFETGSKSAYASADIDCTKGSWNLLETVTGSTASDRKNGTQSVRMRYSSASVYGILSMNFDKANGAGIISIYHAKYGGDANATWKLQFSNDAGANWYDAGTVVSTTTTTLTAQNFTINQSGNVRFKIIQLSGNRLNIDDIIISDYSATSTTYTGTGNWNDFANWSNGFPTSTMQAIVNGNLSVTTDIVCNNLTINSSSVLTINSNGSLTVSGTLINNAGTSGLVIKSDATGTGSIIHSTENVAATIERYIPSWIANYGYHLLSSPVNNQVIDPNFTAIPLTNYDFYKWDASAEMWRNQKVSLNNITNFVTGTGYLASYSTAGIHTFEGIMNVNNVNPVINYYNSPLGKWNLIGNPFPCALDGNMTYWSKLNMETAVHILDANDNTFKVWNADGVGNLPGGKIPAMQGFWVASNASGAILTIPFSARTINSNLSFYKNTLNNHLVLNIKSPNNTKDVTFIYFKDGNSDAADINDASLMRCSNNLNTQLFSYINNKEYCINALGSYTTPVYVNLGFEPKTNGTFVISAENIESFSTGSVILITDLKYNISQNLCTNPTFTFVANTTDSVNRFRLYFDLAPTGIYNTTTESLNIYSFENIIYIQTNEKVNQIIVFNMLGQEVVNCIKPVNKTVTLHQPAGYYTVRVITEKSVYLQKVNIK